MLVQIYLPKFDGSGSGNFTLCFGLEKISESHQRKASLAFPCLDRRRKRMTVEDNRSKRQQQHEDTSHLRSRMLQVCDVLQVASMVCVCIYIIYKYIYIYIIYNI